MFVVNGIYMFLHRTLHQEFLRIRMIPQLPDFSSHALTCCSGNACNTPDISRCFCLALCFAFPAFPQCSTERLRFCIAHHWFTLACTFWVRANLQWTDQVQWTLTMSNFKIPKNIVQGCARFTENLSELTKTWSSGATECGVWIGNCNVKVWKSTEQKLHNIWRSVKFQQNEHTPDSVPKRKLLSGVCSFCWNFEWTHKILKFRRHRM